MRWARTLGCPVAPSCKSNGKRYRTNEDAFGPQCGEAAERAEHDKNERNVDDVTDEERSQYIVRGVYQ